jgi:holliday junction DNA helicase RuvA
MIGSLRGTLLDWGPGVEVLVEVGGIGHRVAVTPRTLTGLGDRGEPVFLYVHHHLREDAQTLYGFPTADERNCFEALLRANGVGPALALAICSVHTPIALRLVVAQGDLDALCLVPGVGKKTAARLLIELKSRLDVPEADPAAVAAAANGHGNGTGGPVADVRDALAGLGYGSDEIRAALTDIPADIAAHPAPLLREALSRLAVARA